MFRRGFKDGEAVVCLRYLSFREGAVHRLTQTEFMNTVRHVKRSIMLSLLSNSSMRIEKSHRGPLPGLVND